MVVIGCSLQIKPHQNRLATSSLISLPLLSVISIEKQLSTNLPTWMQKSPRMVPGFESAGLVSPSITLPVLTTLSPSHTYRGEKTANQHQSMLMQNCTPCAVTAGPRRGLHHKTETPSGGFLWDSDPRLLSFFYPQTLRGFFCAENKFGGILTQGKHFSRNFKRASFSDLRKLSLSTCTYHGHNGAGVHVLH